jgi:four helix bundle protein
MARFENLVVRRRAQDLVVAADAVAAQLRYDAADQLRRSAASVADNIAEGAERCSDAEFARFVAIASGSCAEAQSQLRRACRLGVDASRLVDQAQQIQWMLAALRRRLTVAPDAG